MSAATTLLKGGDIFVVRGTGFISNAIVQVCKKYALDGQADYSHAGIITSVNGDTFEALRHIECSHIDNYRGLEILIARPRATRDQFEVAISKLYSAYSGIAYPWWRIALHYARLAQWCGTGDYLVCSELVAAYLKELGIINTIRGYNPDHIHDMMVHWAHDFEITYRGRWEPELKLPLFISGPLNYAKEKAS